MIKKIVFSGIYLALIIIFTAVPLNIGIVSITLNTLILAVATLHLGFWGAGVISFFWGLMAWIYSLAGLDPSGLFIFPDVSFLPRILTGLGVAFIYFLVKFQKPKFWKAAIIAVSTVLLNTTFVTIFIFLHQAIFGFPGFHINGLWVWITLIYLNFIFEMGLTICLTLAAFPLIVYLRKKFQEAHINAY